jgi:hypothetical protein
MKTSRVLAGTLVAALVLYMAVDPARVRAQIAPAGVLMGDPGCGGYATAQLAVIGDLNGDGAVDVTDLLIFVETFGKALGDAGFNPEADFNCDGSIDVVDLLVFVGNFGT